MVRAAGPRSEPEQRCTREIKKRSYIEKIVCLVLGLMGISKRIAPIWDIKGKILGEF